MNNQLTALLELMSDPFLSYPLAAVELYSGQDARYEGKYVYVMDSSKGGWNTYDSFASGNSEWLRVLQAAKRLTGEAS